MQNKIVLTIVFLFCVAIGVFGIVLFVQNQDTDTNDNEVNFAARLELLDETVEEFQLARLSEDDGLVGLNETVTYVEIEEGENTQDNLTDEQISNFQTYVTPTAQAVTTLAAGKTYEQIYTEAVSWTWVEDGIINGVSEKWLYPEVFLTQTPTFATNPVPGRIASDCESQAYTLVSALRAAGMPADQVRVVTGLVNFGGATGGHAWVEVYDTELAGWFALEATSGNFYDSSTGEFISSNGLDYDYFKTYRYPSIQIWNYFNDAYFYDLALQEGNAPEIWLDQSSISQAPSVSEVTYELPEYLQERREQILNRTENFRNNNVNTEEIDMYTEEDVQDALLDIINQTENLVQEGLTDEERQEIINQLNAAIDEAYTIIEQSNLTIDQKATFNAYLRTIETYINRGLNQLQREVIQNEIIEGLNEIEEEIVNN